MKFSKYIFLSMIPLFGFMLIIQQKAYAQKTTPNATQMLTVSPTPAIIKYDLAYPGMLPDNFVYKLKVLRDKIALGLIIDPSKRIDFLLLQTDKGILATAMLVDKNEIKLAEETALKAENNFTLLTSELGNLPKKPGKDFFKTLETAGLKHQEILRSLIKRLPRDKQKVFQQVINFSKTNYQTVENYKNSE